MIIWIACINSWRLFIVFTRWWRRLANWQMMYSTGPHLGWYGGLGWMQYKECLVGRAQSGIQSVKDGSWDCTTESTNHHFLAHVDQFHPWLVDTIVKSLVQYFQGLMILQPSAVESLCYCRSQPGERGLQEWWQGTQQPSCHEYNDLSSKTWMPFTAWSFFVLIFSSENAASSKSANFLCWIPTTPNGGDIDQKTCTLNWFWGRKAWWPLVEAAFLLIYQVPWITGWFQHGYTNHCHSDRWMQWWCLPWHWGMWRNRCTEGTGCIHTPRPWW